jgi:phosphatidylglycerophosphate synthase
MPRSRRLSPADLVSLSRLLLAGAFVVTGSTIPRITLIGIAGLTDYVDGWLARQRGSSRYGAVIDPATDRAFVLTVVVTLVVEDAMTITQCLVLMARDIVTTLGVVIVRLAPALRPTPLAARWSGKTVTALQFVTLVAIILEPPSIAWLLPIVALASVVSIGDYSVAAWRRRAVA